MTLPDPGLRDQATWRTVLRVGGPVLLGIGALLVIFAMADFFAAFGSLSQPRSFWMGFVGIPLVAVGGAMTKAGYLGPASRYVAGEVTPTLRDTLGSLGVGPAQVVCAACGGRSAADATFCDDCGAPLRRRCAACGADNAGDAKFCGDCGAGLAAT